MSLSDVKTLKCWAERRANDRDQPPKERKLWRVITAETERYLGGCADGTPTQEEVLFREG